MKTLLKTSILSVVFATTAMTAFAQSKAPVFTTIKANPITSVKDQNRSGTCWDYATCGFLESEILRKTGKTVDLAEMYVAYQDYLDCADYHIRMHGNSRFSEGGSCDDVVSVIKRFGIVPEEAMTRPGAMVGDSLANFNEFFPALEAYVNNYADSKQTSITTQWRQGMTGILDAYLGTYQKEFSYGGKHYTPQSFAASLGLDWDDYVSVTSYTHHPFNKWMVIEAPYKWRPRPSFNIPLDQMMAVIDNALAHGYCVAWGGDVSGDNFSRSGLGQTESLLVGRKRRGAVAQTAEGTAEEQTRQSRCECTGGDADTSFAAEIFRYVGGYVRPRDADLRYGEGQERQGILYGEKLVGRLWQLPWHLVSEQELRGDVHHLYLPEQARARQASVG